MPGPASSIIAETPELQALLAQARATPNVAEALGLSIRALALTESPGAAAKTMDVVAAGHLACFLHFRSANFSACVALGERILPMAKTLDAPEPVRELFGWLSLSCSELGRFDEAMGFATDACSAASEREDSRATALTLSVLSVIFERSGDPWQGARIAHDAVKFARESTDAYPLCVALNCLSGTLIREFISFRHASDIIHSRATLAEATQLLREIVALAPSLHDPVLESIALGNLAEALVLGGLIEEAAPITDRSINLAMEAGAPRIASYPRYVKALLDFRAGDAMAARQQLIELRDDADAGYANNTKSKIHFALYEVERSLGNYKEALVEFEVYQSMDSTDAVRQLKARSEVMVTRVEVERDKRHSLEDAYKLVVANASRAIEFEKLAFEDELTGLGNRRLLDSRLGELLAKAQTDATPMCLGILDLDFFKRVNDEFGHAAGDQALVRVAHAIREEMRNTDLIVRAGGEEFVFVLERVTRDQAQQLCERVRLRIAGLNWSDIAPSLAVTASIGLAHAPLYDSTDLLERADLAMYRAKRAGRNRLVVAP